MQGNAFLGAFFAVSPMLQEFGITQEQYRDVVYKQYVKKFGKLGDAVVQSNMEVMIQGFERVKEIAIGEVAAADHSSLRGQALLPILAQAPRSPRWAQARCLECAAALRCLRDRRRGTPVSSINVFDAEFRSHFGYNQPATPLSAMGVIAAATGDTASKYVARRETPLYIPENCTQCMECISVCPDTALPNCSQDLSTLLGTAVTRYVADPAERRKMLDKLPEIDKLTRQRMLAEIKTGTPLPTIIREVTESVDGFSAEAKAQFFSIIDKVPMAYQKVNAIFSSPERKAPGSGGIFSIFVSDLCKGCAACVTACGDHMALKMVQETEEVNAEHETGTAFLNLLPDTAQKYLGLYNGANPADSKTATLRNMLMVRTNYDALVAGDGACAGCGEKSVLRSIAAVTEAYMRPVFHAKSDRFMVEGRRLGKDRRGKAGGHQGELSRGLHAAAPGHRAPGDGPGRRRHEGHQGAHRGLRSRARRNHRRAVGRSHCRGAAHRGLQPQEPAARRRTPGQRHERDGHGRAHRLQHGLRFDRAQQSASLSVDELALPGRRHRGLAHGRELHRRSRAPLRDSRAAGRHSAHARGGDPANSTLSVGSESKCSARKSTTTSRTLLTR